MYRCLRLYSRQIIRALEGNSKDDVLFSDAGFSGAPKIAGIAKGSYLEKHEPYINGTGYVADALEAALWCFWTTDSFRDAILKAANLGDDADTTAAICGQIAGAHYGVSGIPMEWLDKLVMRREIEDLAAKLYC
jgi:ADP-ribosyl-[dinitrogen reductase] hydrolase